MQPLNAASHEAPGAGESIELTSNPHTNTAGDFDEASANQSNPANMPLPPSPTHQGSPGLGNPSERPNVPFPEVPFHSPTGPNLSVTGNDRLRPQGGSVSGQSSDHQFAGLQPMSPSQEGRTSLNATTSHEPAHLQFAGMTPMNLPGAPGDHRPPSAQTGYQQGPNLEAGQASAEQQGSRLNRFWDNNRGAVGLAATGLTGVAATGAIGSLINTKIHGG